jgi:hypothetical protein
MAPKKSLSGGNVHIESKPKRTSIGQGKRKRGSWKVQRKKPMRGQGKG